ncbi:N-acetyl-gamma-glutamyl-phosphate reductase [Mangrovicoccus algicola]|uniref:N-acetyl-gamma-glutamyl-phosphate reductase n=1 Tax=Mangrovicoccus algicola TaxID=2771008 RepID=A0A8J6YXG3_9RHOB|nr:N-acetyl-gamma-glutamyl-phosphate reductase [Mangrovicoccus algicola]MBE3637671.1 N-acetyl-gamma-glutamyl-phosphate reductase [Mangrovicoccus algicola]
MTKKIAVLGASGYTGAELVRLIATHPSFEIAALSADRKAGLPMGEVFPHLRHLDLPVLQKIDEVDFSGIDLAFFALPHGVAHGLVRQIPDHVKIVDLSADFRLRDAQEYRKWYKLDHGAMDLQPAVAYGLPEIYRDRIAGARITANTGCYVATSLLPLIPLLRAGAVGAEDIVIDAKSGASGAGRGLNEPLLFSEANEGFKSYGVAGHRHMGELDQELSLAAGRPVLAAFTPHLVPMIRGMQATIYAAGDAAEIQAVLEKQYAGEPFVDILPMGAIPQTQHVKGSNLCRIAVHADRRPGRVIILSVLDNLMKGASGQALQCANIMLGEAETAGLNLAPVFP